MSKRLDYLMCDIPGVFKNFDKSSFLNSNRCFQVYRGVNEYQRLKQKLNRKAVLLWKVYTFSNSVPLRKYFNAALYVYSYSHLLKCFLFDIHKIQICCNTIFTLNKQFLSLGNEKGWNIQISKIMPLTSKKLLKSFE